MLGIVFVFLPRRRKKINVSFKRTFGLATHLVQTFEWFSIWNNGLENFRFAESNSGMHSKKHLKPFRILWSVVQFFKNVALPNIKSSKIIIVQPRFIIQFTKYPCLQICLLEKELQYFFEHWDLDDEVFFMLHF